MADLYKQINSYKHGRIFIITLLLFILLAIVYAVIVYQSGKIYNRHSTLFWGLAEFGKRDAIQKKDTVYIAKYSPVPDSLQSMQQVQNDASAASADDANGQAETGNNVYFVKGRLTTEGEELIIKKMRSFQQKNGITSKFVTIVEYPAISEQNIIEQVKDLLTRNGYRTYVTLQVISDVPSGISIGKTSFSGNEYGVILYIGL